MIKYSVLLSVAVLFATISVANTRVVHKDKDANPPPPPPGKIRIVK